MIDEQSESKVGSELSEALVVKRAFEELLKSTAWTIIIKAVEAQIKTRTQMVMMTPRSELDPYSQEFLKGEVVGMQFILGLVATQIEELTSVIGALKKDDNQLEFGDSDPAGRSGANGAAGAAASPTFEWGF